MPVRLRNGVAAMALLALWPVGAQQNSTRLEFEVAAINPANANKLTPGAISSSRSDDHRLEVRGYTLKALVMMAYRLQGYQIAGGPKWFDSDGYDIDAKSPAGASVQQMPERLQSLLADRFQLALHHETRTLPAYALVVNQGGPKMQPAPDAKPMGFGWGPRSIRSKAATMQDFAEKLAGALQHPVLDRTGLAGLYQVDLQFAPVAPDPSETGVAPDILDALREQLGLRLETTRGPVDVLVIDRAEKPSGN